MADTNANSMKAPRRAKQLINTMLNNRTITQNGLQYLEAVTDPFHDTELIVNGYPDVSATRSITQVVTYTATVTAPALAAGGNWDAHVFFLPMTRPWTRAPGTGVPYPFYTRAGISHDGTLTTAATPNFLYGGWNVISGIAGFDWTTTAGSVVGDPIDLPAAFSSGTYRLIATGLEVVNTTASLYKGGSVTAYRSPSTKSPLNVFIPATTPSKIGAGESLRYTHSGEAILLPPSTQSNAALYPNSRTWGAEDGVYLIGTLNDTEVPDRKSVV